MVCEWGMSDKLGPLAFGEKEGEVFLGRDFGHVKNYSEATAITIDEEIQRIVEENYARTREILTEHKDALIEVAEALLERENMDGSEIREMIFGPEEESPAEESQEEESQEEVKPEEVKSEKSAEVADDSAASEETSTVEE
jgi:cell division protease FtsH